MPRTLSQAGCPVEVAIAALFRRRNGRLEILITRRPEGAHLAGCWELPGGKIEAAELPSHAASREILEETGIRINPAAFFPLPPVVHTYPELSVRIFPVVAEVPPDCEIEAGEIVEYRWISLAEFAHTEFPPANAPITEAVVASLAVRNDAGIPGQPAPGDCNI